jgi:hypothetical protein
MRTWASTRTSPRGRPRAARPHSVVGVNVAEREVEVLKRARENFVRKRREMAEQMIPSGAAAAHFAPNFAALQIAIEALDRAIRMKGRYRRTMHPPHLSRRRCRAPRLSRPMLWMWISIQPETCSSSPPENDTLARRRTTHHGRSNRRNLSEIGMSRNFVLRCHSSMALAPARATAPWSSSPARRRRAAR